VPGKYRNQPEARNRSRRLERRGLARAEFCLPAYRIGLSAAQTYLAAEEAREYDRFIELGDIIATLRLKAERQLQFARG